ncbi:DUF1367 family protein [Pectobacterium aroidearum]|uniref:DUF1367 family protein n=1 Tax=Pectobacterium aroidearum TaxID=1201031 RepID=A0AAW3SRM6_9GAMM|nr:DUF1367 family protein [Pectobacterium aroidearum]MBA5202213.1 DUF1367 family protein [Pectobacterium aroidearum]MBA5601029.1 DUF1367 family protein [Pectobacterium aroidearum]
MTQLSLVKSSGGILVPSTPDTREYLNRLKVGSVICADFKKARNAAFHRKFFSLLNLGFHYFEPNGGAISPADRSLVNGFVKWIAYYAGHEGTIQELAEQYLNDAAQKRAVNIAAVKSFESFRAWVTIEAGFYFTFYMPDGTKRNEPKSISFAKMDETEFSELYRAVLNVLWNYILYRTFPTQQAAENAAAQLLEYVA